ncbi:MAG: PorV/PorQ family protein [Elusimicrobia bacterium]|nr:PorV/PorQ family protein [Elusimicrobiota bacterium]
MQKLKKRVLSTAYGLRPMAYGTLMTVMKSNCLKFFAYLTTGLLSVMLFVAPGSCENSNAGTSAAQFLKIGAGARAAAMAEAQSAAADDVYAGYYNPAGLALIERPMMGAMHAQYLQGAGYQYGALALPIRKGSRGVLALSISNLGVNDLERRTQDTDLPVDYFDAANFAYSLSYARRATDRLCLGVTGKLVRVSIDNVSGNVLAADIGLRYRLGAGAGSPVDIAFVARNMGAKLKFGTEEDPIPSAIVFGVSAHPLPELLLDLDLIRYRDTDMIIAAGGEYRHKLSGKLQGLVRAGYSNHYKSAEGTSGVTLGAGLSLSGLTVDFAWVPFGDLGNTFRYSLLVQF